MRWIFSVMALPLMTVLTGALAVAADEFPTVTDSESERELQPMSAEQAAGGMDVPEGFSVSVFASEPEVRNPIAMAWDDRGRLWIAENYTYADRTQRFDLSLRDRVLIFDDADGDGRPEERRVFTDTVQMLTSVEVGRGGVWLMCPPQLLFVPDGDQDDVPDGPARVVLDGFTVARDNYHNFANGLRWGPDGWLYGRCGHSCPGRIGPPGTPDAHRVPIDGGIWRYHPERDIVEVLCHGTVNPWGHDWDQHGELFFINTVIGHAWHAIPGAHFRESFGESQNPAVYDRMDTIADHFHFDRAGGGSNGKNGDASAWGGGHAHIGMMICLDDRWPVTYRNRLFTLNMHGRRANVDRLERFGAGYVARHEPDFLVAGDPFFRAIDIQIGPDGCAYVIDWSDTGECHEHDGVHRTSGRIYRIQPPAAATGSAPESQRRPVVKPWCAAGPGRLPTLWRAYRNGETTTESLRALLRDDDEHVRAWAIRLLTDFWPLDTITGPPAGRPYPDDPQTRAELVRLATSDSSGLVHLVLASTLQRLPVPHRAELARPLIQQPQFAGDRDLPRLIWFGLIPLGEQDPQRLADLVADCRWPQTTRWMTRFVAGRVHEQPEALNRLLTVAATLNAPLQDAVLAGMDDAFRGWRQVPEPAAWSAFVDAGLRQRHSGTVRDLNVLFGDGRALDAVRRVVLNRAADMVQRSEALETLIAARPDDLREVCESLLRERILNAVAARGLAESDDPEIGRLLAGSYRRFHPDDRRGLIAILVSRPAFAMALLDEIERDGVIRAADVTPFDARQMLSLNHPPLTRRLESVWGRLRDTPADRRRTIEELRTSLTPDVLAEADLAQGRFLFRRTCSQCHRLYGDGAAVAPDLTGSQRHNLDYLLGNIVDPGAVVGRDYRMSILTTRSGRVHNGLLVARNERTVVLQTATDLLTLAAEDVAEVRLTEQSSMPDGLLTPLTPEDIRDLIAYLMHPAQVALPDAPEKAAAATQRGAAAGH